MTVPVKGVPPRTPAHQRIGTAISDALLKAPARAGYSFADWELDAGVLRWYPHAHEIEWMPYGRKAQDYPRPISVDDFLAAPSRYTRGRKR